MELKYIVCKNLAQQELIYFWGPDEGPEIPTHKEFFQELKSENDLDNFECVSAGYATYDTNMLICYGMSKSLNVGSRPSEDSYLLNETIEKMKYLEKEERNQCMK